MLNASTYLVGCLPSLAASAAVKVLCRSKCVWGSVRLSPARLQTVSPLGSVALLPDPDPQPDSTAVLSAHQHRHRCSILYIGFHNTIFYIAEYESLHLELGCMSTKPMGALVGKVSNCVSMFTDVTIGELCTVTQLTHTPQLGSGPGHSQWN